MFHGVFHRKKIDEINPQILIDNDKVLSKGRELGFHKEYTGEEFNFEHFESTIFKKDIVGKDISRKQNNLKAAAEVEVRAAAEVEVRAMLERQSIYPIMGSNARTAKSADADLPDPEGKPPKIVKKVFRKKAQNSGLKLSFGKGGIF